MAWASKDGAAIKIMTKFRMPSLGAGMEAGKLIEWKIKPGDRLKRDHIVAEVETEKADIDVAIFAAGIVQDLLMQPGEKVRVGRVLATSVEDGEAPHPRLLLPPHACGFGHLGRSSQESWGVDVTTIHGTGPGGAITREDVERATPAKPAEKPAPAPVHSQAGMRRAIAAAMARSNREIPYY